MDLQQNKDAVFAAIERAKKAADRSQEFVNVIAVTKYVDSSITKDLVATGVQHIGENRVDVFLDKYRALSGIPLTWHLIGSLQRRKVKDVINYVDYFHALDSVKLAQEIQKRAEKKIKCFLQVNISKEASKHGFLIEELEAVLEELLSLDKVEVVGLMTMAPFEASHAELMSIFSEAKALQERLAARKLPHMPFTELSMGMSGDFTEAIACGATFIRIGTAFFK
ncbi:YggS family pyridoxal phosphate enzyme [Streptococcus azizii]|uniref:Pyridoxal phosphate homeostasis protein n=1 Tax=Streptococcus azizii TaxID=1579424 RepID=A0AB36JTG4_9STRE|nr:MULTISPECIES: YggS family pyridoxal phosphate-dependent enzyme [Streptococcus]MBF0775256.1 YggS family pyridoxal phosphate-dependent enzyme [Streptococcus sp. 19428wD3_AN2]ONK29531.1 YggS family pyridoxal phosphate enzyme [Streptococcus azizii]ONK30040.1 YggS family pyridoxal phosphate enzyme [Streptococcus azizii]ONK30816.1 YggS family pyridoxal phosphate enzyme [Streptococcus azizii]TFU84784.1 YggS family pyridoxal phosphate-dependent enzyme [Streptococcus sp. AN2]